MSKEYTNSLGQTLKLGDVIVRATSRSSNVQLDICVVEEITERRVSLKLVALNRNHYEWSYLGKVKAEPSYKKSWLTACNFIVIGNVNEPVGSEKVSEFSAVVKQLQAYAHARRKEDDDLQAKEKLEIAEDHRPESLVPSLDELRAARAELLVRQRLADDYVKHHDAAKLYETYVEKYPRHSGYSTMFH